MAEFFARKTADVIVKETGLGIHVVCLFCVSKFTIHSRSKVQDVNLASILLWSKT